MKIGNYSVDQPVFLAPMAGYTNLPFRLIGKKYGADAVTTEMVSAKGLYYGDKKTRELMRTDPAEAPAGIQIFGSEPEIIAKVTREILNDLPFAFIDFNAGCPAPKIVKNGDGSALLKDLGRLSEVVAALVEASNKPVFVKTRLGWDSEHIVIDEAAEKIAEAGASAIAIHGRTREAYYSGKADWSAAARIAESLDIPVILNGDISTAEDALRAFNETKCGGIMVGRAAVGNPFIFREIKQALAAGSAEGIAEPTPREKIEAAIEHIRSVDTMVHHPGAMREMRKQLVAYTKGMKGAVAMRRKIFSLDDADELIALFEEFAEMQDE